MVTFSGISIAVFLDKKQCFPLLRESVVSVSDELILLTPLQPKPSIRRCHDSLPSYRTAVASDGTDFAFLTKIGFVGDSDVDNFIGLSSSSSWHN